MGRNNRATVKNNRRMQRPKWLREREEQAYRRVMDDYQQTDTVAVTWREGR